MEVIIHFIFELIKIPILGGIYATIPFIIIVIIGHLKPASVFGHLSKKKIKLWFFAGLLISFGLFIFSFTYWGNHGLGDNSQLPIGHHKVVCFGGHAHITDNKGDQISIKNFTYDTDRLYASSVQNSNGGTKYDYLVWDLPTGEVKFYKSEEEYLYTAKLNDFPDSANFEDFWKHYNRHWHGWRKIFLP
jgi:hypothetical protein